MSLPTETSPAIDRLREHLTATLGWRFDAHHDRLLQELLLERAQVRQRSVDAYVAALADATLDDELHAIAAGLTVTESSFFRYPGHVSALEEVVLPERLAANPGRPVRLLSAGCASGEEPYTMALLAPPEAIEIEAVDIDPDALSRARAGWYSSWALRETPAEVRDRHFRSDGRGYQLDAAVRQRVRFRSVNLNDPGDPVWEDAPYDVILCRNVLMYLTEEAARAAVARLTSLLHPGGYLLLGHAETLRGVTTDYALLHSHRSFYYRLGPAPEGLSAPDTAADATPTEADPASVPLPPIGDAAWVDLIREATSRIHQLTDRSTTTPPADVARDAAGGVPDLTEAITLVGQERFADAIEILGAFGSDAQAQPDLLLLRAVAFAHAGRTGEAAATCAALLRRDPLHAGAHYVRALCAEATGDVDLAQHEDELAVHLDPGFAMPRLHLGLLARRLGRATEADAHLRIAHELLRREDPSRVLLFGGGFTRESLLQLCAPSPTEAVR